MENKKYTVEIVVDESNTALAVGSGSLKVFATPMTIALMENAAAACIADDLGEGNTSVGTAISVSHVAATPMGMKVWAESEVTLVDGKRIELKVSAYDEKGLIGEGRHERFIVDNAKFMARTEAKKEA